MFKIKKLLILILALILIAGCGKTSLEEKATHGMLLVTATDKAVDIKNIYSINITITKIEILPNGSESWQILSDKTQTINLIELSNNKELVLLSESNITKGLYTHLKLTVSQVLVDNNGLTDYAKLPSNELKLIGNILVEGSKTTVAKLDFIASESLHATGIGELILAPVIKLDVFNNADASITENKVDIKKGKAKESKKFGMDENGNIALNYTIDKEAVLRTDGRRVIRIK